MNTEQSMTPPAPDAGPSEQPRVRRLLGQMITAFDGGDSEAFFDTFLELTDEMQRHIDAEVSAAESSPDLKQ